MNYSQVYPKPPLELIKFNSGVSPVKYIYSADNFFQKKNLIWFTNMIFFILKFDFTVIYNLNNPQFKYSGLFFRLAYTRKQN